VAEVKTITLGCRLNFYESETIKSFVQKIAPKDDVIIINTCAVTHEAERQSRQSVRKSIRENPKAKIIVTGCAAKTSKSYFENLKGITKIVQNDMKNDQKSFTDSLESGGSCISLRNNLFVGRARAFIQIQNGCDNHCSFCIVPLTRGHSKSLPLQSIIDQIDYFVNAGFKEIVLSGIDIGSYGKDLDQNITLSNVLEEILNRFKHLNRIRISSIDPICITDDLFEIISNNNRIMPHLHLSVQSGDNHILKKMNRRHSRENVIDICQRIRSFRKDFVFGADLIAGFPGETDIMFNNTIDLLTESQISLLHVFPYSARAGTLAASFLQLPHNVVYERSEKLRKKGIELRNALFNKFVGKKVNFIIEKVEKDIIFGKTDHFLPIKYKGTSHNPGDLLYNKEVLSFDEEHLIC
jgi:threonylcarbamoyladenosine tRNA methylthiotransferase MtaB